VTQSIPNDAGTCTLFVSATVRLQRRGHTTMAHDRAEASIDVALVRG
jgi:hypothetical protein